MNIILIFDLILVSVWILFSLSNFETIDILILPLMVVRVASVFSLQLRERKSIVLILTFIIVTVFSLTFHSCDFNELLIRPFARMYDYIVMLFAGQSTLMEGAWHYLANHGEVVPRPNTGWEIFTGIYIAWLLFTPLTVFIYLLCRKRLRSSRWNWKKIGFSLFAYTILCVLIRILYEIEPSFLPGLQRTWWLSVFVIPLLARLKWKRLSLWCRRYIIIVSLFALDILSGINMESMASLVSILITIPMFYYWVGYKWMDGDKIQRRFYLYLLIVAGLAFWTAQYGGSAIRLTLLTINFVLIGCVSFSMWEHSRKIVVPIVVFIICSVVLPSIAIGYNQFACFGAKRLYSYTDYNYSYRGLLMVRCGDHIAIRDRFGYITPVEYEQIEPIGNPSKPFVKFKSDGFWGVYDLERQKVVVDPKYTEILPYDKNAWRLIDEYTVRYGCHDFFVSHNYYNRYWECGTVSDCPFIHGLEDDLPLKYDCEVKGAKHLDFLLTEMMTKLWAKPDSVSYADFYWDWTAEVNGVIENLQSKTKTFDEDGDYSSEAMLKLEKYIDPECGGSQTEMNATSYVLSTIENYRMLQAVQDLDYRLSPIDMRREYTLFNKFMSAYEDWEDKRDESMDWYSDRPRERKVELCARFKDRHKSIDDIRAVVKGDTVIPPVAAVSQSAIDEYFNRLASTGNYETKELVAPIKQKFKEWIDYRNQITSAMPRKIAVSYRNQTRQLEKFYTSNEFLYEDEL